MWHRLTWTVVAVAALVAAFMPLPVALAQPIAVQDSHYMAPYAGVIVPYKNKIFAGWGTYATSVG